MIMDGISLKQDPGGSVDKNLLFIVQYYGQPIGWLQIREVMRDWPVWELLNFLNSPTIKHMFKGVDQNFRVNYFWLEMLYIEPQYRGHGWGIEALNIILSQLPAYSVLVAHPYKTADMEVVDLISFYKKQNFHVLEDTTGNPGEKMLFTFVQNR